MLSDSKEFAKRLSELMCLVEKGDSNLAVEGIEKEMALLDHEDAKLQIWKYGQLWQALLHARSEEDAAAGTEAYEEYVNHLREEWLRIARLLVTYCSILAIREADSGNLEKAKGTLHIALRAAAHAEGDDKYLADAIAAIATLRRRDDSCQ